MSRADILLHPIRLRIVQAVAAAGEATTAAIAETLADVPPATLYRHVGKLLEADVLQVVGSRQARGATERTLAVARARLGADDLEGASREDHERWFLGFLLGLFGKLERQPDGPVVLEGFGYHTHQLWLTDDELTAMASELREVIDRHIANRPDGERRLRSLSTVLLPEPDVPVVPEDP